MTLSWKITYILMVILDATKFYFSNRVVSIWNSLPEHILSSPFVPAFKNRLFHFELVL